MHLTCIYSSPPRTGTSTFLLPRNSVLIVEVSFGEREDHMQSQSLLTGKNLWPAYRGVLSRECPLREGPLYTKDDQSPVAYVQYYM